MGSSPTDITAEICGMVDDTWDTPAEADPPDPVTLCDDGTYSGDCSPIVINLQPGPYTLSSISDPVNFDIDADGAPNRITWTRRGSAVAFLALDRNGNGTIDDGSELFGTATRLLTGRRARNGFEALKELDSNGDFIVNAGDLQWWALLLWTDMNYDGLSQREELRRVAATDLREIETRYFWTNRRDSSGNVFRYRGTARFDRGWRPIWDVYFHPVP